MNKDEILDNLEDERERFMDVIEGFTEAELVEPGVVGEWSVKDILAHISSWEAELVKLLWQVEQGLKPSTVHFSEVNVDERNAEWHEVYKDRPLDKVMGDFEAVRRQTERRVQAFSDQDLNSSERFPALKGNPLWEWIENDSYGHEAEHREEILAWRKAKGI